MRNDGNSGVLTAKQSRFIDEYMVDMNGAAAAERAGYSQKTSRAIAAENLAKPYIKAELQARGAALARKLEVTREGVVQGLLEAFEVAKADRQPAAMVSAARELGKLLGFYEPTRVRVDLGADGRDQMARFEAMSDADLLKVMGAGHQAMKGDHKKASGPPAVALSYI
ncbi:MAG: hypothetical protein BWK72_17400 [Rhodoferax ferrireducens]|uniref:Terminase small subunit n=1 Tax=Rhodoferax ferrireducens TaxID=192843 RepID=A0A1W9KQ73_9BURK|nr:MAG: hypothetical protein BWK72_17400 [Rhodoferax ferrireducens]